MRHRAIIDAGKTGSISRKQARSAALAAKTGQPASNPESATNTANAQRLPQTLSVWERFLGQFGATGSRNVTQSTLARAKHTAPVVKKTAAKKKGTKKVTSVA